MTTLWRTYAALLAGPLALLATLWLPAPTGMPPAAWLTVGVTLWLAIWWLTEAVPLAATALLPLLLLPLLKLASLKVAAVDYAHPLIFLFLGGFLLSAAMEKTGLHQRIALKTLSLTGQSPSAQIAGLMAVTAFLSMWMSNTATAVMMLPIALSIIHLVCREHSQQQAFAKACLLAVAYSASIGGLATLIGTPPNALLAAYLQENYQIHIGFAQWMLVGVPLSLTLLVGCWWWLTRWHFRVNELRLACSQQVISEQLAGLGPMRREERWVLVIFIATASAWVLRPLLVKWTGWPLDDTMIVLIAAIALFALPIDRQGSRLLTWTDTRDIPWGILLLFGGGLSLAAVIKSAGLADFIASQVAQQAAMPWWLMVVLVTSIIIFLTEVTSNTATAAGFLPLLGPIAMALTNSPMSLTLAAALAASCAFMMPVATPPNAIVFSSGHLQIKDMAKAGLALNLLAIALICAVVLGYGQAVLM